MDYFKTKIREEIILNRISTIVMDGQPKISEMAIKTVNEQKLRLFNVGLAAYCFFVLFNATPMSVSTLFGKALLWGTMMFSSFILLLIWVSFSKHSLLNIILAILLISLSVFFLLQYQIKPVLPAVSFLLAMNSQISFEYVLKRMCQFGVIICVFVFLCCLAGLSEDNILNRDNLSIGQLEIRAHSYGFWYYSTPAYFSMNLINVSLFLKRNVLTYRFLFILIAASFVVFLLFVARLQLFANLILITMCFIYKVKCFRYKNWIWKYVGLLLYPSMMYLMYYLFSSKEITTSDWFLGMDIVANGRLSINVDAFETYPINLWGNLIEFSEGNIMEDYFYIDSGYVYSLLCYGLIFSVFLVISYSLIFIKVYKSQEWFLYAWVFMFAFLMLFNNFMLSPLLFPLILLLFTKNISAAVQNRTCK